MLPKKLMYGSLLSFSFVKNGISNTVIAVAITITIPLLWHA